MTENKVTAGAKRAIIIPYADMCIIVVTDLRRNKLRWLEK